MVWLTEHENFIKENWSHMTAKELANALGRTKYSVKSKIEAMMKKGHLMKKDKLSNKIYEGVNLDSMLESQGRKKTESLFKLKEDFKINEVIKVKTYISVKQLEITEGLIIQKTDWFLVVKTKNYIRCFKYKDFLTKDSVVI